jgi:hypothetical protein
VDGEEYDADELQQLLQQQQKALSSGQHSDWGRLAFQVRALMLTPMYPAIRSLVPCLALILLK